MPALLSIIVPVYNTEEYLDNCIQSVLNQIWQDWELILINDGSTDRSGDICEQYAADDNRIHVIHTSNHGQSAARNKGIEIANGEYITFVDSDDEITPETYAENIKILKENPSLQVVQFPTFEGYNINGGILCKYPERYFQSNREIQIEFLEHLPTVTASVCNKIFKKEIFNVLNFHEGHLHEDYTFVDQLVKNIDNFYISEKGQYHYYHRSVSTTHTDDVNRHLDLLSCDISRLERRYAFPELKHLLIEQYIFVIRELQNIIFAFPNCNLDIYKKRIKRSRPPLSTLFTTTKNKDKELYLIISLLGLDYFTKIYQKLLASNKQ